MEDKFEESGYEFKNKSKCEEELEEGVRYEGTEFEHFEDGTEDA